VAFTDLNDQTESDIKVFSAFIQDEISLSDNFDIVLGGRFDSFDISTDDIGRNELGLSRSDEKFSPRAGLIYKPKENVSVYGSYSQTFLPRTGEQFAGLRRSSPGSVQSDILSPDEFENLEAGLKWDFTPGVTPRELPENTFSIWSNYQVTDRFGLGLGATHQGEALTGNGSDTFLPAFTRFDAAAYYDVNDDVRVQVNIENLTDELYFPTSHSTHQATVGAPLNARFTVSGRF